MTERILNVGVSTLDEALQHFRKTWKNLETGKAPKIPYTGIHFASLQLLLRTLSPARMQVITTVKQNGPISIRALAKILERDYRNVHADVTFLCKEKFLIKGRDGRYSVPWDKIVIKATIPLGASA